jgi:hypothetical protein
MSDRNKAVERLMKETVIKTAAMATRVLNISVVRTPARIDRFQKPSFRSSIFTAAVKPQPRVNTILKNRSLEVYLWHTNCHSQYEYAWQLEVFGVHVVHQINLHRQVLQ